MRQRPLDIATVITSRPKADAATRSLPLVRMIPLMALVGLLAVLVMWIGLRGGRTAVAGPPLTPTSEAAPIGGAQVGPALRGPVQVVRFTLYDVGIFPREVHVKTGIIAITIEDLSGADASAEVTREVGLSHELVSLVTRTENGWRGRKDVLLTPGRYAVSMTGHLENSAALVVEP